MVDFQELSQIININSYTKNKNGVDKNGDFFKEWLKQIGFKCESHKRVDIGNHLHFKSLKDKGVKILLLGHLDTVFAKGEFEYFSEDEEWIYGPGVCDMKGGNYIALVALRRLYKKYNHIKNIDFLLVSDEESGSDDSKKLTSKIASEYDYALVYEASGRNAEVVIERKGVGTFFIDIKGRASHAGNNYLKGINANLEASYKLQELTKLTNLELGTTVNVGLIEGGIGANTISPKAKLTFEIRYTSHSQRDILLKAIDTIVKKSYVKDTISTLSGGIQRDVMQSSSRQKEFIQKIEKIIDKKLLTESRGGVSDANITSSSGLCTLDGFGPYGDGDHTIKERALKSSFESRVDLSFKILESLTQQNIKERV